MEQKYYWILGIIAIIGILVISGCTRQTTPVDNIQTINDSIKIVSEDSFECSEWTLKTLKEELSLNELPITFDQISCGKIGYGGQQPIQALLKYGSQTADIQRISSGGGSGGWLFSTTNITINEYKSKNQDLYYLIHGAICDYFDSKCSVSRGVRPTMMSDEKCKKAFEDCKSGIFEQEISADTILISINYHSSRDGSYYS